MSDVGALSTQESLIVPGMGFPERKSRMGEVYVVFLQWLREEGYVVETDDEGGGQVCVHVWKGPGRCRPVMYTFQFAGNIEQSACHRGDSSDDLNVWCQYTDKDDRVLGMFRTMRGFKLSDPAVFDQVLAYLRFHDGNAHPVYGRELKYQRARRRGDDGE